MERQGQGGDGGHSDQDDGDAVFGRRKGGRANDDSEWVPPKAAVQESVSSIPSRRQLRSMARIQPEETPVSSKEVPSMRQLRSMARLPPVPVPKAAPTSSVEVPTGRILRSMGRKAMEPIMSSSKGISGSPTISPADGVKK